jgi:hypothetical protein
VSRPLDPDALNAFGEPGAKIEGGKIVRLVGPEKLATAATLPNEIRRRMMELANSKAVEMLDGVLSDDSEKTRDRLEAAKIVLTHSVGNVTTVAVDNLEFARVFFEELWDAVKDMGIDGETIMDRVKTAVTNRIQSDFDSETA